MKKVSVFVDVQNIYYTTKQIHHCHFNYTAFLEAATANRQLVNAIAYAIDKGDEKQIKFQNTLKAIGFEIKLKPYIQRSDGTAKGDWDVGITIDILDCAQQSDIIVLASGDGDFDLLLNKIRKDYDTTAEVYGVEKLTALSLINAASTFIAIEGDLLLNASG
jgi:uncharacterized LabA/DUF88 family protein